MNSQQLDVDYIAKLARLELTDQEKATFSKQMQTIVGYCSKINKADVSNVPAMTYAFGEEENAWQEDVPEAPWPVESALLNAPKVQENQIIVPRVV